MSRSPPAPTLPSRLSAAIDGPICVAFSGGPDSTALLHALAQSPWTRPRGLRAIHVDHGLHPSSGDWARHCLAACEAWQVPCTILRVAVPRDSSSGLEAAAREARYAALAATMSDGEVLTAGHHRDDQAETFLLRALRGSGTDGLAAMRPLRRFGPGWLWRPLLDLPRDAVRDYLAAHGLHAIDDPANRDDRHDRNWLRKDIMPLLRERWPQAAAALARSAALCAEAAELLDAEDIRWLAPARAVDPRVLHVDALASLPAARRARALRRWVGELGLPPLPGHASAVIERELLGARADAEAEFAWSGAVIRRWRGMLHADVARPALPADFETRWNGLSPLRLPTGERLAFRAFEASAADIRGDFIVRARHGGERIALPGRAHSHALKHVLQDLGVPPWERARLPLLFDDGGELLAAGDLVISGRLQSWLREAGGCLRLSPAD